METEWDYSDRASTYDKRADYSEKAIEKLITQTKTSPGKNVADIGAGTGKLTKLLAGYSLKIYAVEPNDNMRMYGRRNTADTDVVWSEGVGEKTCLPSSQFHAAFFGSSFNVLNQEETLKEVARILTPDGWFACMWNHRDLGDPLQKEIEDIIHKFIPRFDYGKRRQDPTGVISQSNLFGVVETIEANFTVQMNRADILDAWRSHDTLFRQSDGNFDEIINEISSFLKHDSYKVPYCTRIWFSQLKAK